ncbi:hypothetical protein K0M31_004382 [Melipona bicolor]|uniref:Uncharacterized protein n=1 Tax=Melipona bicolor TaxID=60889 RepID=A0AA40FWZ6_9HYME|nr:hypothetical protein K0M31_004382 [Melipona bicolor]
MERLRNEIGEEETRPEYLTKKGNRDSQRLIARARVSNVEEYSKYWLKGEERRCRLCERQSGTPKHLIEEFKKVERCEHSVGQSGGGQYMRKNSQMVKDSRKK